MRSTDDPRRLQRQVIKREICGAKLLEIYIPALDFSKLKHIYRAIAVSYSCQRANKWLHFEML